jgi:hypothetical protein
MRLAPRKTVLLAACLLAVSSFVSAEVSTFNSLPGNGKPIPNGFAGLDWLNFYHMNRIMLLPPAAMIQLAGGVPPTTTFAYNNGGAPASFSASDTFTFNSAWLASDGSSPMTVEVVGLLGGNVVDRTMLVLRNPVPTQEVFNWSGIDGVRFVPQTSASSNGKLQFALSQMVINGVTASVPEPGSMFFSVRDLDWPSPACGGCVRVHSSSATERLRITNLYELSPQPLPLRCPPGFARWLHSAESVS